MNLLRVIAFILFIVLVLIGYFLGVGIALLCLSMFLSGLFIGLILNEDELYKHSVKAVMRMMK